MIYALLVGIDNYPGNLADLRGCVNDVTRFDEEMQRMFGSSRYLSKVLVNEQACYDTFIATWDKFFRQTKPGDTAIFHFSGHGSRQQTAVELEPWSTGYDETLVLYNSRLSPNNFDLADKELAFMIRSLVLLQADVVVVLDCCHAGSGTRTVPPRLVARRTASRTGPRKIESYLYGKISGSMDTDIHFSIPKASHLLFAACEPEEKALEDTILKKGLFSKNLLEALIQYGINRSYRDNIYS